MQTYTLVKAEIAVEHVKTDLDRMMDTLSQLSDKSEPYSQTMIDLDHAYSILEEIWQEYKPPKQPEPKQTSLRKRLAEG